MSILSDRKLGRISDQCYDRKEQSQEQPANRRYDPTRQGHELRYTFTSLAALGGSSIEAVSRVLGHSSIQITIDTYQHLFLSQTQSVVANDGKLIPRYKKRVEAATS